MVGRHFLFTFKEIRQLGVGYYKFSSNEEERIKQRELLDGLRNKV
jgi:hypothetical protein